MSIFSVYWSRIGIQLKLQLLIQVLLLVLLLPAQYWLANQLEYRELLSARERTTAFVDSVFNGLNTLMEIKVNGDDLIGNIDSRSMLIKRLGVSDKLKELRVIRAKGVNDEFGEGLPEEKPVDDMDRSVLASGKPEFKMTVSANGDALLRAEMPAIARKVYHDSKCLRCHGVDEGTVLGAISITVDIQDDLADIRRVNTRLWMGQGILQMTLFFAIGAIVRRSLHQLGAEPEDVANQAKCVARGNLCQPIALKTGDTSSVMAQFRDMQQSLARVVGNVRKGAETVATASEQISQSNSDLSARTENQASALEQTAASMGKLNSDVKHNVESARLANQLALSASDVASRGGDVVARVVQTMKGINDSSRKIADIISVIDGIAFQTNILALNAAVEAARAGEQGRGFAVVANEVRSLASRSADAAKEIKSLISASVLRVDKGMALVDQAGSTMQEVVTSIHRVTDIVSEITLASVEQSSGISQVVEATSQMDQVAQQNAALVEEMAAAAQRLNAQAEDLVHTVAVFKLHQDENTRALH